MVENGQDKGLKSQDDIYDLAMQFHGTKESRHSFDSQKHHMTKIDAMIKQTIGSDDYFDLLTTREKDILSMILKGLTNNEIAERIERSLRTVEYHRNRVMQKMGTKNVTELMKVVLERSLLSK